MQEATFVPHLLVALGGPTKGSVFLLFLFSFFFFFRAALVAYGSSRLGVELEPQLAANATATAMWDP